MSRAASMTIRCDCNWRPSGAASFMAGAAANAGYHGDLNELKVVP
jgi:hypothetical protein